MDDLGYKLTVLSGRQRFIWMNFVAAVRKKGSSGRFALDEALYSIEEAGDTNERLISKTDQK